MPKRPPTFPAPRAGESREVASRRGYTKEWSRSAAAYRRDNPLCVGCLAVGRTTPSTCVDHVVPHRGDQALFWSRANWQASCGEHHDVVKQRLEHMWARGELTDAQLSLSSPIAQRLTLQLMP